MSTLRVIPALFLVLLSGCGQVYNVRSLNTAYTAPPSAETARLRIISDGMVRAVPGRDCLDWNVPGAGVMVSAKSGFADRNGASLGMPGPIYTWDGAVSSEQVIPANTPIAFHYIGLPQAGRQCFNTMTFIPKPGMDYMVRASMSGSCSFELAELPKGAERWSPIEPTPSGRLSMCHAMDNF